MALLKYRHHIGTSGGKLLIGILVVSMLVYHLDHAGIFRLGSSSQTKRTAYYNSAECSALMLHMRGNWKHQYAVPNNGSTQSLDFNTSSLRATYLPVEINWIRGYGLPEPGCQGDESGLMYVSPVGNQCSCRAKDFQPSLSQWVSAGDASPIPVNANRIAPLPRDILSPSLQPILKLAKENRSLCFAGDSIDLQFYFALRNNLLRQIRLQNHINISLSSTKQIAVNYTNETGVPMYTGWMTMNHIEETTVHLRYNTDRTGTYSTSFRYFQMYGWSPWVTSFMDDCDVVIFNIGLHYGAHGEMRGTHFDSPQFSDDMKAVITHLTDFSSQGDRLAIWR
jgi:hypothetical protein